MSLNPRRTYIKHNRTHNIIQRIASSLSEQSADLWKSMRNKRFLCFTCRRKLARSRICSQMFLSMSARSILDRKTRGHTSINAHQKDRQLKISASLVLIYIDIPPSYCLAALNSILCALPLMRVVNLYMGGAGFNREIAPSLFAAHYKDLCLGEAGRRPSQVRVTHLAHPSTQVHHAHIGTPERHLAWIYTSSPNPSHQCRR